MLTIATVFLLWYALSFGNIFISFIDHSFLFDSVFDTVFYLTLYYLIYFAFSWINNVERVAVYCDNLVCNIHVPITNNSVEEKSETTTEKSLRAEVHTVLCSNNYSYFYFDL